MSSTNAGTWPSAAAAPGAGTRPAAGRTDSSAGPARTAQCGLEGSPPAAVRNGRFRVAARVTAPRSAPPAPASASRSPAPDAGSRTSCTVGGCTRCTFADRLGEVLDDGSGRIRPELVSLSDSLLAMDNPLSGLTWLYARKGRTGSADDLLRRRGRGEIALTHEAFHTLQPWRAAAHLRDLLMSCGVLPTVDKQICSFERWLVSHLADITDPDHVQLARRFATWKSCRTCAPARRRNRSPQPVAAMPASRSSTPRPSFDGSPSAASSCPPADRPTSTPGTSSTTSTVATLSGPSCCGAWPTSSPGVSGCPPR